MISLWADILISIYATIFALSTGKQIYSDGLRWSDPVFNNVKKAGLTPIFYDILA